MKAKSLAAIVASISALAAAAVGATPAQADFGLSEFDVRFAEADGAPARQAGSHPYKMTTSFQINSIEEGGEFFADGGDIKDLIIEQVKGFVGSATAVPTCDSIDFANTEGGLPACGDDTAVGVTAALLNEPFEAVPAPVYNLAPPPGVPARLGFVTGPVPLVIDVGVKPAPDYNIVANVVNIPQPLTVFGSTFQLWGVPADPSHDFARGKCATTAFADAENVIVDGELNLIEGGPECPSSAPEEAFLTLPRACEGPLATNYELDPWSNPGAWVEGSALTHDDASPPNPAGFVGCGKLDFLPTIASQATTDSAETGTGLDFDLSFTDPGLTSAKGIAGSDMKRVVVTLPEGVTANPSLAEGLGVCTPADLDRETLAAAPGQGCPNASKIGTVAVRTPLLDQTIEGSVFLAQQDDPATSAPGAENPFDSLLALYIVFKDQDQGILVKQAGKVEPDPRSGQLVSTFDDVPQVPFSHLDFHFREGQRAPLISPPGCGSFETRALFTPHARPKETVTKTASFQITRGVNGGPCPPGGVPPFEPGFQAGTANNNAASHSPFHMRITRRDGDQDLTRFDATLPQGVVAKLAGVSQCPDAAIALTKAKTGRAELANPSCPANSKIGRVLAGAGVGSSLTYVPGSVYLAGPFAGAPLSVVGVVPAVAGPFDVGVVLTRQALVIDPKTAEVRVDGSLSDPIPHILAGIPLKVRDIQVYVDRPEFTLNPTSCDPSQVGAALWGGGIDVFSLGDDSPVSRSSRFQAANCSLLPFKPRLSFRLRGGTKRGGHPALTALLRPRPGDANISGAAATLPRSAFLDQSHIRTICTRVQFAAESCPKGAIYGYATARTPLLDVPVQGPVYLRSSDNTLPDLVADLRGPASLPLRFELVGRTDSVRGGIRNTFDVAPDVPVSMFKLALQGGEKGLIVNSTDICAKAYRARVIFKAHNGKRATVRPKMRAQCVKARKGKERRAGRSAQR